jgi:hypothetical protein
MRTACSLSTPKAGAVHRGGTERSEIVTASTNQPQRLGAMPLIQGSSKTMPLLTFGVAFLANPDLVRRYHEGLPLNVPDPAIRMTERPVLPQPVAGLSGVSVFREATRVATG